MKFDNQFWISAGTSLAIVLLGVFLYDTFKTRMATKTSSMAGRRRYVDGDDESPLFFYHCPIGTADISGGYLFNDELPFFNGDYKAVQKYFCKPLSEVYPRQKPSGVTLRTLRRKV